MRVVPPKQASAGSTELVSQIANGRAATPAFPERAGASLAAEHVTAPDDEQASARRPIAAAWLGLIDQVVVNQVPVVVGAGRPFFATGGPAEPVRLETPTTIVRGDRVTYRALDVSRRGRSRDDGPSDLALCRAWRYGTRSSY